MKRNYLIDGYNLGFKIPAISKWINTGNTDHAVQLIQNYILSAVAKRANRIILVFDGKTGRSESNVKRGKIQVIFSSKPETADDIIRKFLRSTQQAKQWIVVSSDNEIRYTAEDMGASALLSEHFIASFQKKAKNQHIPNKEKYHPENVDVDYWLKKFKNK